ncbi:MAG: hypothetical protein IJR86_03945 [Bacteroidaceae bacterium]|nr:hypothetical protein [Bacteroidaceae bacterium]
MSSFVVSKVMFIRAAGLMYGIEESKRDVHKWFLEHVRKDFEHAYTLNVYSVNEQYERNDLPDEKSYDEDFENYRKIGRDIYESKSTGLMKNAMPWPQFRYMMMNFFGGVMYQIENDYASRAVSELFYRCIVKLFEQEIHKVPHVHTEINLEA